jgi:H+/Cl- antiporter ClcA
MLKMNDWKKRKLKTDRANVAFLIFCALIIASIAFFINREILGSGKEIMERVLFTSEKHEDWYVPVLRMLGPALSFTSGGAGGILPLL